MNKLKIVLFVIAAPIITVVALICLLFLFEIIVDVLRSMGIQTPNAPLSLSDIYKIFEH